MEYGAILDNQIQVDNGRIIVCNPLGARVDICPPRGSNFKAAIMETCRHAALHHLSQRMSKKRNTAAKNAKAKRKAGREVMEGISPYADTEPTMKLLSAESRRSRSRTMKDLTKTRATTTS